MVGSFLSSSGVSTLKSIKVGNKNKLPEFICVMGEVVLLHNEQIARYNFFYIYCIVLKRLTTPSDFHIPLPSIVPFAHS
jgi:hypothetical protein